MLYKELGLVPLRVSALGVGSSSFRDLVPQDGCRILERAYDMGVNYYDTAISYKNGEASFSLLPEEKNKSFIIATKTGHRGGKGCIKDLQDSLNSLRRQYIDVWMTHMIQTKEDYDQCVSLGGFCDIATAAKKAGLVRAYGASFHGSTQLIERVLSDRAFEVVMFQFNLICRETVIGSSIESYRKYLLPLAQKSGTGIIAMKVLAGGEMSFGAPGLAGFMGENDPIAASLRFACLSPTIHSAVVGVKSEEELIQDINAVDGIYECNAEKFEEWAAEIGRHFSGECTRCGICISSCPEKISIPQIFRLIDQYRFFAMRDVAKWKYQKYSENARRCSHCMECSSICPNGIDIAEGLKAADSLLGS